MRKTFNSSARPAVLPESILQGAADEMLDYKDGGMSVMEISHRSTLSQPVAGGTEAVLRAPMNIPNGYEVLFLQSGTSL